MKGLRNRRSDESTDRDILELKNSKLFVIIRSGKSEKQIVNELTKSFDNGAKVDAQNTAGKTLILIAVEKKYKDVIKFLLERGANPQIKDHETKSAITIAATQGDQEIIKIFRSHGFFDQFKGFTHVDVTDSIGNKPLSQLMYSENNLSKIREYIARGANINYLNEETNERAIDIAWKRNFYNYVFELLKADSYFPQNFSLDLVKNHDKRLYKDLWYLIKEREKLHLHIKNNQVGKIKSFIQGRNPSNFFNLENKSALETALESQVYTEILYDLLGHKPSQIYLSDKSWYGIISQFTYESQDTLLIVAIKSGKRDNIDYLIKIMDLYINHHNTANERAIDVAWRKKDYLTVLKLLKLNSYFPKQFSESNLSQYGDEGEIKQIFHQRRKLNNLIDNGKYDEVLSFLLTDKHKSKSYISPQGKSAPLIAVEKHQYRIFALLQSRGVSFASREEEYNMLHKLSDNEKKELTDFAFPFTVHQSYSEEDYILSLVSKSRPNVHVKNFQQRVTNYYKRLDSIPMISTLLKAVSRIDGLDIVFDEIGYGTLLSHQSGCYKRYEKRILIASATFSSTLSPPNDDELLSTIVHEFTHAVVNEVFENNSNPYSSSHKNKQSKFTELVEEVLNTVITIDGKEYNKFNKVIDRYPSNQKASEIIARLSEVLIRSDLEEITSRYPIIQKLRDYYNNDFIHYIKEFIESTSYRRLRTRYELIKSKGNKLWRSAENLKNYIDFPEEPLKVLKAFLSNRNKQVLIIEKDTLYGMVLALKGLDDNNILSNQCLKLCIDTHPLSSLDSDLEVLNKVFSNSANLAVIHYSPDKETYNDENLKAIARSINVILSSNQNKKVIFITEPGTYKKFLDEIKISPLKIEIEKSEFYFLQSINNKVSLLASKLVSFHLDRYYSSTQYLPINSMMKEPIEVEAIRDLVDTDKVEISSNFLGKNIEYEHFSSIKEVIPIGLLQSKLSSINTDETYIFSVKSADLGKLEQIFSKSDIQDMLYQGQSSRHVVLEDSAEFTGQNFIKPHIHNSNKRIVWISVKYVDSELHFHVESIYDPNFYIERSFNKNLFIDDLKSNLGKPDLNEVLILKNVDNKKDFIISLRLNDSQKENFKKNLNKGMIKIFNSREIKKAESLSEKLSKEGKRFRSIEVKGDSSIKHIKEDDFTRRMQDEKVIIISGDAGIGKTTTLTHLYDHRSSSETPSISESHWGFRLNLGNKDHLQAITSTNDIEVDSIVDCLLKIHPPYESNKHITRFLLKESIQGHSSLNTLLMFDGFDEVLDQKDREHVLSLIKFLKDSTKAKLWITTRTNYEAYLEKELATSSTRLNGIDPILQEKLVRKYLDNNFLLFSNDVNNSEHNKRIEKYTEKFLKRNEVLLKRDFLTNPLNLNLLLANSKEDFKSWMQGDNIEPRLDNLGQDIFEVYEKFINKKYEVHLDKTGVASQTKRNIEKATFDKLASKMSESITLDKKINFLQVEINTLLSIGIVNFDGENVEFIHTSFREYFISKVFVKWLTKAGDELSNNKKMSYVLEKVFTEPGYQMIRVFMNSLLRKTKIKNEALSSIGESIVSIYRSNKSDQKLLMNALIQEKEEQLVSLTLNSIKTLEKKDLYEIFSQKDKDGGNIIHYAADSEIPGIAIQIMNTMKENFSASEIQSLLMLQDKDGKIPFYHAASNQLTEVMVSILNVIDKKEISTEEILNILMLQDKEGNTVLHYIPDQLDGTALSTMITFLSKERFSSKQIFKLFQLQNKNGETLLHIFADNESGEMDESIYKIATFMKEKFNQEEIYSLLSKQNVNAETIFHYIAASELDLGIGQILELIEGNALSGENLYNLFSIKDNEGKTFLHHFPMFQSEETNWNIKRALDVMEKKLTRDQIHKLFSEQDKFGKTFLHYLPDSTGISSENLSNILTFMFKNFSTQEVYNLVSIKSNENGYSVIHSFTDAEYYFERNKLFLDTLVEKLTKTQLYELLSIKDSLGQTALISNPAGTDILRKVKECGKMYDSLKIQDNKGQTVFHHISLYKVSSNILHEILGNLDLDKISEILMLKDIEGKTFLHYIRDNKIAKDFIELLNTLPQETIYKLALSSDKDSGTFLHDFVSMASDAKDILAFFERKLDNKQIDHLLSTRNNVGENILHVIGDYSTAIQTQSHRDIGPFSNKLILSVIDDDHLKECLDPILNLFKKSSPSRIYSLLTINSNKGTTPIDYAANNPTTSKPLFLILTAVKEILSLDQLYDLLVHKDKKEFSLIDYINSNDLDTIDNVLEAVKDKILPLSGMAKDRDNQDLLDLLNLQPSRKRLKTLEKFEESKDAIGLKPSTSSCLPGSHRKRRSTCEEDIDNLPQYNPLEEHTDQHTQSNSRLYSDIAYLFSIQASDPNKINTQNIIHYNKNIGDLINEREINHSKREKDILRNHYEEAKDFISSYPKETLLTSVNYKDIQERKPIIFDNGKTSVLVSYNSGHYEIYSKDYNYGVVFETNKGMSFNNVQRFVKAHFRLHSGISKYKLYKLSENLPPAYIDTLARFRFPDKVLSDLTLIEKGHLEKIDNIPAKIVRECFLLDEKVPEMETLHENFFNYYSGRITIRVEEMHNVISQLSKEESQELMNLIEKHNFPIDKNYLNTIPIENRILLENYHNKVYNRLNQLEPVTVKELSDLSWRVLEESMSNHPDISTELKESSLKTFKNIYDSVARKTSGTGTQMLFFLPDVIRSVNTGNYTKLAILGGMIAGDAAFNHGYEKLISKLEPVLSKSRTSLLRKLPITSPIFKVLTIHSIYELHSELSTLPANSEKREIIKHQLGEQYFTAALMCAEMIGGIETGPLWIALMTEQLIYSGIAFRKENHLDISLTESIWMSLGFEQEKFQSLLKERKLLDLNLSLVKAYSNQSNIDYDFAIVKVPRIIEIETKESEIAQEEHKEKWWSFIPFTSPSRKKISNYLPLNTTIDFREYTPKKYCMEDNVFLESNDGYKRVSSTYTGYGNYCEDQPFPRILGDGLAALYAREKISNNSSIRNMISTFDPREGNLELKFTHHSMKKLDEYYGNNMTTPYLIHVKVMYKPSLDRIQIPQNTSRKFVLDDSSNRVISNYEINSTIPFTMDDNALATSITLIGINQSYINGSMSNFSIFDSNMHKTGGVLLTNKTHVNFNLLDENLVLDKFKIDVPSVNFLYRRKIYDNSIYSSINVNSNVIYANMSIVSSTSLCVFRNYDNKTCAFDFLSKYESTSVLVQILNINYTRYSINYFKKEIKSIIYDMCTSLIFARYIYEPEVKSLRSYDSQGQFYLRNITTGSLSIEGTVNGSYAKVQAGSESMSFQITLNSHKHTEIIPFSSRSIQLDNKKLKFKKVVAYSDYSSSLCHSDRNLSLVPKFLIDSYLMLEFNTPGEKVLYHLKLENNKFNVNGVYYKLSNNKIYVHTSSGEIDANKLIKLDDTRTVSILINRNLKNSTVSLQEKKIKINNITLNGIPDQTLILFENSGKKPIPTSVKMIKNALGATRDKRSFGRESLMSDVIKMNNYELSESKIIDSTENSANSTDLLILKNYDVTSTVLLLDLFIRKLTGEKYHNTPPHSLSELEARGYILNIMEKFKMVLEEAHKISKCETPLDYQEEYDLYFLVTKYVKSGQFYKVSDALYSTAQKICPEKNKQFMINVRSGIEEITGHRIQKETQNNKSVKLIGLGTFLFFLSAFVCTKVVSYFTNRNTNESTRQENDQIPENENFVRSDTSVQAEGVHNERRATYSSVPYELSEIKSVLHKEENISSAV